MARKAKARTWAKRLAEAFDRETGAQGRPKAFLAIGKYLETTETEVPDELLGIFAACTHAAFVAGEES